MAGHAIIAFSRVASTPSGVVVATDELLAGPLSVPVTFARFTVVIDVHSGPVTTLVLSFLLLHADVLLGA